MRRAWPGRGGALERLDARHGQNAASAAAHARELGAGEVVVITSSWHRARARVLFRSLLPGVRVTVLGVPTPGSPRNYLREAAVFPLVPFQVRTARRATRRGA
jgi:uncharacterized SAM-binding protein YcdF (DUF218 family)